MTIRPERGGRITSLRFRGEELLDQGIGVDNPRADDFVEAGAFGWDEMVPNVERTSELPDHGEAWRLAWAVSSRDRDRVRMSCRGRLVPWELEREVVLGDHVEVSYRYTNVDAQPQYGYWCAHPLFKFEPDMQIGVPVARVPEGSSTKVFLPKGSVDRIALGQVELVWDPLLTPYVGIWVCNGGLGGYRQIAVEPATGGHDRPHPDAPPPLLDPGESLEWWLQIRAL